MDRHAPHPTDDVPVAALPSPDHFDARAFVIEDGLAGQANIPENADWARGVPVANAALCKGFFGAANIVQWNQMRTSAQRWVI